MTKDEAMQQALEALIDAANVLSAPMFADAVDALKAALEQPEQQAEPVACRFCFSKKGCWTWQCYHCGEIDDVQQPAPPQQYDEDEVLAETARYRAEVERLNAKLAEPMTEIQKQHSPTFMGEPKV